MSEQSIQEVVEYFLETAAEKELLCLLEVAELYNLSIKTTLHDYISSCFSKELVQL